MPQLDWNEALSLLQGQMRKAVFDTWLSNSRAELSGDQLTVYVRNAYAKEWLEKRLHSTISRTIDGLVGQPVQISYQIEAGPEPNGLTRPTPSRGQPGPGHFSVELVSFDPTQLGFVMTSRYALIFWQPLLGQLPFAVWNTLRAFAWRADKDGWPSIETLAAICTNGNRHRLLGRAARSGRGSTTGALEVLRKAKIINIRTEGRGPKKTYLFRVLENLPLLTPSQVDYLPPALQDRHKEWLRQCSLDYEEWRQLDFSTLIDLE